MSNEPVRTMGIDGSSKSLAFCVMEGEVPTLWGKMDIEGSDVYERCGDINRKLYGLIRKIDPDHITIEQTVFVNNRSVVLQLAKIMGAAIGVANALGVTVDEVAPITWQSHIGNKNYTKTQKSRVARDNPDASASKLRNIIRKERKQYTMDWVKEKFDVDLDDDDVADAFGVCWWKVDN